jgi:hypothetical protein
MIKKICIFSLVFSFLVSAHAVQVKKIEIKTYEDFQKGELDGANIDDSGRLFIGPQIKAIGGPDQEYYLALDVGKGGDIYIGTGHKASVFRIRKNDGKIEKIFENSHLDVYALLVKADNEVYVGTSPNGKIYKIGSDQKATEVFTPTEKFIWDMKADRQGNIICAVGNNGGVYQIKGPGDAANIYSSEDTHIISLFVTRSNAILAGSGDRGVLYRIDNRKVKVLYDAPFEEIRGICEDKEGNIFFSACRGVKALNGAKAREIEPPFDGSKDEDNKKVKEKSVLYCLDTNGVVEKIWSSNDEYIYSICYNQQDDTVIIGTGNAGRVYKVKKDGGFSLIYESESAQIFKIVERTGGFTLIGNNTAAITGIESDLNSSATYFSKVFDLEVPSKFGRMYWNASASLPTQVALFTRAGNSNIPDNSWSEWSPPYTDPENSNIGLTDYRYLQIKIALNASNIAQTPYVNHLKAYYIQSNLKPRIKKIEILKAPEPKHNPRKDDKKNKANKHLKIKWSAADPNDDQLKFNLYLKKTTDRNWISFKEDITEKSCELPTEMYEDGKYELKIVADDTLDNPPGLSGTSSMVSHQFTIDSTAPVLKNYNRQANQLSFNVSDLDSIIQAVLYSPDGQLWFPLAPDDMIGDSKSEEYKIGLKELADKKIIFIKVIDEFGNYKVYQREL